MITVSKLASRFGLSRTALLYYDRIGLLRPTLRTASGYRLYGEDAVERLRLIGTYKSAGLPLAEVRKLLDAPDRPNLGILKKRIVELDEEIAARRVQQRALVSLVRGLGDRRTSGAIDKDTWIGVLRSAGMDQKAMDRWHAEFERNAPAGHHSFLRWLGIPEKDALAIRAVASGSKSAGRRRAQKRRK